LKLDGTNLGKLRDIINRFDPEKETDSYVRGRIEKTAMKLIHNAADIESAWNLIDSLGLRQKLITYSGDPTKVGSLAHLLQREPLRTRSYRGGSKIAWVTTTPGKTAGELGIKMVTHDTTDIDVYEAITRSKKRKPNVLISRQGGKAGENAALGDGFYTLIGEHGAWNSGYPVRFEVDGTAVDGIDFKREDDVVVWANAAKLKVVDEPLNINPVSAIDRLVRLRKDNELAQEQLLLRKLRPNQLEGPDKDVFMERVRKIFAGPTREELSALIALPLSMLPQPDFDHALADFQQRLGAISVRICESR
jgi:hypothetical protein